MKRANSILVSATVYASHMLGSTKARKLDKADTALGKVRSDLDNMCCADIPEYKVPAGCPRFPLYASLPESTDTPLLWLWDSAMQRGINMGRSL